MNSDEGAASGPREEQSATESGTDRESAFEQLRVQDDGYSEEVRRKLIEIFKEPDYICLHEAYPAEHDRDVFINTMFGMDRAKAKQCVLVLDIIDDHGYRIRTVVHNNKEIDKHAEGVLKEYLTTLLEQIPDELKNYLETCEFIVYINWSPCGQDEYKCVGNLVEIFKMCKKASVFFVGFYIKPNTETGYFKWLELVKKARFKFMREQQYEALEIRHGGSVESNITQHNSHAILKTSDENLKIEIEQFCKTL